MNITATSGVNPDLHRAAVAFEGFFHGMLLKAMRKGVQENKLFHGGRAEEVFRGMQDDLMAERMAEKGGLGIAKMIEKEMGGTVDLKG